MTKILSFEEILFDDLIAQFGETHQMVKCVEEMAELIQAITKSFDDCTEARMLHVLEEMVDVNITTSQLAYILKKHFDFMGLDYDVEYRNYYTKKINRIKKIVYEGGENED